MVKEETPSLGTLLDEATALPRIDAIARARAHFVAALALLLATVATAGFRAWNGLQPKFDAALLEAARTGDLDRMRLYLTLGADPNQVGRTTTGKTMTPLEAAVDTRQRVEVVQTLLDRGADANVQSSFFSIIEIALRSPTSDAVIQLLLERGANIDLNRKPHWPTEPLEDYLLLRGRAASDAVVQAFVYAGAIDPAKGRTGYEPLARAVAAGNLGAVRILLSAGAATTAPATPSVTNSLRLKLRAISGPLYATSLGDEARARRHHEIARAVDDAEAARKNSGDAAVGSAEPGVDAEPSVSASAVMSSG